MARALREAHDLVLDRRAIARTHTLDDAREERRAVEAAANDLVRALVRVRDPARDLRRVHRARADEAHHRRRIVARLPFEPREVDGAPVDARRRSGLEPTYRKCQLAQSRAERLRGRIARASRLVVLEADVDQAAEERARRQHHRIGFERHAHLRDDTRHPGARTRIGQREIVDGLLEQREVGLVLEPAANGRAIERAIRLRARRAHRGALARVQRAELDARLVRDDGHRSAERIDLLD